MNTDQIIASLDKEIERLRQIQSLLSVNALPGAGRRSPGRPKGSRRKLSAEAREKIAAAQRKRWAKAKRRG